MYLTYEEYEEYGGTLDETAYINVEFEAETFVNWITFNRLREETEYPEEVKLCMYDIINLIVKKRTSAFETSVEGVDAEPAIHRMQNDGVSVTYNTMSASQLYDKINTEVHRLVLRYLNGVKNSKGKLLTYRGLYADE